MLQECSAVSSAQEAIAVLERGTCLVELRSVGIVGSTCGCVKALYWIGQIVFRELD